MSTRNKARGKRTSNNRTNRVRLQPSVVEVVAAMDALPRDITLSFIVDIAEEVDKVAHSLGKPVHLPLPNWELKAVAFEVEMKPGLARIPFMFTETPKGSLFGWYDDRSSLLTLKWVPSLAHAALTHAIMTDDRPGVDAILEAPLRLMVQSLSEELGLRY